MEKFDLKKFLKTYKPKKLEKFLFPYLRSERLRNYRLLGYGDRGNLVPRKTYIKYVKLMDAFQDKNYDSHIRAGGILLAGGTYLDGQFKKLDDKKKWTHLLLKLNLFDIRIYIINISRCYIFYRVFGTNRRDDFEILLRKVG
ncbi:MAG: hypothetical protein QW303_02305 [Nitrososphaerota archaeon]